MPFVLPRRPVFVIGTGRCGTTLMTDLIQGAHISCLKERQVQSRFPEYGHQHIFNMMNRGEISIEDFQLRFCGVRRPLIDRLPPTHVYCEKIPHGQWAVEEIRRAFPDAKFIEIYREGKDTVQSMIHAGWYAPEDPRPRWAPRGSLSIWHRMNQFEKCCLRYRHTIAHTVFNTMTLSPEDYLSFPYEELMRNPEVVLRLIESFVGEKLHRGKVELRPSQENWRSWTEAQLETYHSILGDEGLRAQTFLGYETWSTSLSS